MKHLIGLTLLLSVGAWAADMTPMDVKPGQWETTVTGQMTGITIPPEALAQMTPEQRAKVESAIGARGAKPIVSTNCRTREKLAQAWNTGQQSLKSCTTSLITSTSSKQEVRVECDRDGKKTSGTIKVEAVDSEHIRGSFQMTAAAENNHAINLNYTFTEKWLGAACTEK